MRRKKLRRWDRDYNDGYDPIAEHEKAVNEYYAKRNAIVNSFKTDEEYDEFVIKENFNIWRTIVETGKNPRWFSFLPIIDSGKLYAIAYLGFRPNHPQTAKYRRWLKRLANKPKALSEAFWDLTSDHFGEEDNYLAMASFHAMLHGIKRFIKANKLYKVDSIKKEYKKTYVSMHSFLCIPKRDRKNYRRCMRVWKQLVDSED